MKTLYIETSTECAAIALVSDELEITVNLPSGPNLSKNLGKEVADLLGKFNFKPTQVAVGSGPGSLTGIRVGQSMAKALSYGWNIPLFEYQSPKAYTPNNQGLFAVLIDAKSAGVYLFIAENLGNSLKIIFEPCLVSVENAIEEIQNIHLLLSPTPQVMEKKVGKPCQMPELDFRLHTENYLDLKPASQLG